jgi:hypothetical protein
MLHQHLLPLLNNSAVLEMEGTMHQGTRRKAA